jgi:hypothetical protein
MLKKNVEKSRLTGLSLRFYLTSPSIRHYPNPALQA